MGKYFAFSQGFEEDVANSSVNIICRLGLASNVPKKTISYSLSIIDKLDTLTGFF